jgi:hypothetical protein
MAERRTAGPIEQQLLGLASDRSDQGLSAAASLYFRDLAAGRGKQRRQAISTGASDFSQSMPRGPVTSRSQGLDQAVARGRGLSRVLNSTADRFDSQLLRDRVASAEYLRNRRGRGISGLGQAAGLEAGVTDTNIAAREARSGIRDNTLGTAVGLGAGFLYDRYQNRRPPTPASDLDITRGIDLDAFAPPANMVYG